MEGIHDWKNTDWSSDNWAEIKSETVLELADAECQTDFQVTRDVNSREDTECQTDPQFINHAKSLEHTWLIVFKVLMDWISLNGFGRFKPEHMKDGILLIIDTMKQNAPQFSHEHTKVVAAADRACTTNSINNEWFMVENQFRFKQKFGDSRLRSQDIREHESVEHYMSCKETLWKPNILKGKKPAVPAGKRVPTPPKPTIPRSSVSDIPVGNPTPKTSISTKPKNSVSEIPVGNPTPTTSKSTQE